MSRISADSQTKEGRLKVELEQGDQISITVSGELDYSTRHKLNAIIEGVFARKMFSMAVDLSGLEFIDSSGLGILIMTKRRIDENGGLMSVVVNEHLKEVLETMHIEDYFDTQVNMEQAKAAVQGS